MGSLNAEGSTKTKKKVSTMSGFKRRRVILLEIEIETRGMRSIFIRCKVLSFD